MNCRTSVPTATGNLVTTLAKHYGGCAAGPCWSARFGSRQSCFLCNYIMWYSIGIERLALLGWATGGHWSGYYASLHSEHVSHLILVNTLYGASSAWALRGELEGPKAPARF